MNKWMRGALAAPTLAFFLAASAMAEEKKEAPAPAKEEPKVQCCTKKEGCKEAKDYESLTADACKAKGGTVKEEKKKEKKEEPKK